MTRFAIRTVLAVLIVLTVFGLTFKLAERHNEAALEDLVKHCMEKGMDTSYSWEDTGLTTTVKVHCEKP